MVVTESFTVKPPNMSPTFCNIIPAAVLGDLLNHTCFQLLGPDKRLVGIRHFNLWFQGYGTVSQCHLGLLQQLNYLSNSKHICLGRHLSSLIVASFFNLHCMDICVFCICCIYVYIYVCTYTDVFFLACYISSCFSLILICLLTFCLGLVPISTII